TWITVNGETIPQYANRENVVALNVANHDKNLQITIGIHLNYSELFLNDLELYSINDSKLAKSANKVQKTGIKNLKFNQTSFTGEVDVKKNQKILMTTIPAAPGWKIKIDGKNTPVKTIDNYFIGAKIKQGRHKVQIYY
ncbi:YfhO family protein, partial [Oenococcus oeni]